MLTLKRQVSFQSYFLIFLIGNFNAFLNSDFISNKVQNDPHNQRDEVKKVLKKVIFSVSKLTQQHFVSPFDDQSKKDE